MINIVLDLVFVMREHCLNLVFANSYLKNDSHLYDQFLELSFSRQKLVFPKIQKILGAHYLEFYVSPSFYVRIVKIICGCRRIFANWMNMGRERIVRWRFLLSFTATHATTNVDQD